MATAVAARSAATSSSAIPPSSPFSLLLRRSRFASYDPAVKQTYSSPPAHADRGDWGLKRPLALKKKRTHITLESYEHHAQFVEWNPADNQVKLVKRVEEMGTKVKTSPRNMWWKGLGKAKTQWLIDSEYAPGEGTTFGFDFSTSEVTEAPKSEEPQSPDTVSLDTLGKKGPGAYGAGRPLPRTSAEIQVMPNIHAMSPKEFKRYLAELRALRPEFKKYLSAQTEPLHPNVPGSAPADKTLLELSQDSYAPHHRNFLRHHASELSKEHTSLKFEPQPHPSGGLQYTHPTPLSVELHENFFSYPQRGMVLHPWEDVKLPGSQKEKTFAASFGGIVGELKVKTGDTQPFLFDVNTEEGCSMNKAPEWYDQAMPYMKVANPPSKFRSTNPAASALDAVSSHERGLVLHVPPTVVGRRAQNNVENIQIQADLVIVREEGGMEAFNQDNPWEPGSKEYIMEEPRASVAQRQSTASNARSLHGYTAGAMTGVGLKPKAPGRGTKVTYQGKRSRDFVGRENVMGALKGILHQNRPAGKEEDF